MKVSFHCERDGEKKERSGSHFWGHYEGSGSDIPQTVGKFSLGDDSKCPHPFSAPDCERRKNENMPLGT